MASRSALVVQQSNKAGRHDVIKLVTTYERGVYGNEHADQRLRCAVVPLSGASLTIPHG